MIQKNAVCWLWKVTKKKMGFLLVLTLIQGIAGAAGACFIIQILCHTPVERVYRVKGFSKGQAK